MFPEAFWSAVVRTVGVTISVASSPAEKFTRPDCTRQAAVEASAEPPMYTTLSGRTLDDAARVERDLGAGAGLGLHDVTDVQLVGEARVAPRLLRVRLHLDLALDAR